MRQSIVNEAKQFNKKRSRSRRRQRLITITAAIIIFCTTYALILPAITLENVFCGIEEHVHDASCYVQKTEQDVLVLDCDSEKLGVHAHVDECYGSDGEVICGYADFIVHQHSGDCFDGDKLVCKLPTVNAHVHNDSCYLNNDKEAKLLCGYKEIILHEHTDECFDGDELICGSVETLKHIHNEDCFSVSSEKVDSKKLYCQLAVGANHQHNELCFGLWELSCGKDTHIHGASCRANEKSDVETREEYEKTLEQVELSGNWREDILAIAQTQLGYTESKKNYVVAEDGTTLNGYTRYGAWYGDEFGDEYRNEYGEWSGMFIAFCLNYAGVDDEDMPYDNNFERWVYELKEEKLYHKIESHYETKIGDVVFFDNDKYDKNKTDKRIADRVGFVSELLYNEDGELTGIKTIEGDLNGCVDKNAYELDDETIIGFGEIPKRKNKAPVCDCGMENTKLEEHSGLCERKAFARALGNENNAIQLYNIWLTIPEDVKAMLYNNLDSDTLTELNELVASIPEINEKTASVDGLDFSLTGPFGDTMEPNVQEIDKDAFDGLKEYLNDTDEHLFSGAYDICVVNGDEKAEFENPIQVAIAGLGVSNINPKYLRVKVYHLVGVEENDVSPLSEHTEVEVMDAEFDENGNLCFETDDFSVFYFTVDFHYEDITFKIDGYTSIELSKLFDELELPFNAADAKSVTFSNEKYVTVSQIKDDDGNVTDWLLTSNEPFTSTETLKIEFVDGTKLELEVTDEQTPVIDGGADTTVIVNVSGMANDREVVVNLLNNGVPTGQSMILNSANSFKGSFTNLPEGSYSVEYTDFNDYVFGVVTENESLGFEWNEVDTLTRGKTYVLVHDTNRAMQNSSSDDLSRSSALTISNGKITSNVSNAMQWYYDGYLQSVATERYLYLEYSYLSGASTESSTKNNWSYTAEGYLRQDTSTVRYMRYSSRYRQTTDTDDAEVFTLYEGKPLGSEITYTLYAEQIVYNPEGEINSFEHNKTIDDLNDGASNPDTSLAGDDFYRLYLDMTGKSEPIDLLLVVDGSSSMDDEDMEDGMRRDEAVMQFLNGSTNRVTDDGFIPYFLGLNEENNVAVVQFYGLVDDVDFNDTTYVSTGKVDYTHDSEILLNWTKTLNQFIDCTCKTRSGTNYEAGLMRATEALSSNLVRNNGHRKVMIFLSDGVPTLYQINANDIGTVGLNDYVIQPSDVGKRYAEGLADYYQYNRDPSKVAFDDFMKSNPGITVFTIGISDDINAENTETSQSPDVLKYMAENGNGDFYSVHSSMTELKLRLESIFYPQGVTITDELSKYVRYYSEKPDVKVTMTHSETGEVIVLYQNGAVTTDGRDILTGVTYTPGDTSVRPTASTGSVSAVFKADYQFLPQYTYTLSFNVQNTQTGYDEIANTGVYNAVGDQNTDYGSNNTSSGKDGFYSNDKATVSYLISGVEHTDGYLHPVVQVSTESLIVKKEWIDSLELDEHDSIEVALVLKHTVDGVTTETQVGQTVFLDSENDWQYVFTGLPKQHFVSPEYEYTVQEIEIPSGYSATYELTEDENGVLTWVITNSQDNGKIIIQKVDVFGNPIKLEGISFELYEDAGLTNQFGDRYYTDENGQIVIEGISTNKTYWLVERTPPAGYKVMASSQKITFTEGQIDEVALVGNKYLSVGADGTLIVKNYPGYELPETGGIGTIVIGAIGILLITAVVVLAYVTKHKKRRIY